MRLRFLFLNSVPLDPSGEARTASTTEATCFDLIDDRLLLHAEGFFKGGKAAFGLVSGKGSIGRVVSVLEKEFLLSHGRM